MKRVAAALLLLASAIAVAAWSGYIFRKEMDKLSASLNELVDCSETCSDAELAEKTDMLLSQWNSSSRLLHSLVIHEGMDELELNITALPLIIEHSEREEFRLKCIEAINQIQSLTLAEKLSLENIL